jgi:hypothetical protein
MIIKMALPGRKKTMQTPIGLGCTPAFQGDFFLNF